MKTQFLLVFVIFFSLFIRFYVGIYEDDEFGEESLFIKHRPIWKWRFYSPRGMSDLELEDLSPQKQKEQIFFDEFVRRQTQ